MTYRRATVQAAYNPGASGTVIIPVYLKEIVSRFIINFGITMHTVSVMTDALAKAIKKIELVDGSLVLFSLSGPEAVASNYYRTGKLPKEYVSLTVGDVSSFDVAIMFGRYLWDTMLAFDPTKFISPQIRITFDGTIPNAGVTVTTLAVYADIMDGMATKPTGIILSKDQNQYAGAASSHEYIDLPVDYPLLMVGVRGDSADNSMSALFDNFKFSYDQDAYIFLDQPAGDYIRELHARYPLIELPIKFEDDVTADTIYCVPTEDQEYAINYDGTAFVTATSLFAVGTFTGNKLAIAASVTIKKLTGMIRGSIPHAVVPFWFGELSDPTTWYKPGPTTKFRADLLGSANIDATDTVYLFTEQLRTY